MSEISVEVPTYEVEVEAVTYEVDVEVPTYEITVELSGAPGPPGDQGPPGVGAMTRFIHTQAVMSPTWIVAHNLNCHPNVVAEDAVGNVMHGSVTYVDNNTLLIGFAYSITGRANCL